MHEEDKELELLPLIHFSSISVGRNIGELGSRASFWVMLVLKREDHRRTIEF